MQGGMGEAKRKRRRHAEVLINSPDCIYCSGRRASTTVDHMPPRIWFRQSQRPKGFEFGSCRECNAGTSAADVVSALMALTFPGVTEEASRLEWDRLVAETTRVAPEVISEIILSDQDRKFAERKLGLEQDQTLFWAGGQSTFAHMTAFAAKAGFALHYEFEKKFVSRDEIVQVRWFTNHEWLSGIIPDPMKHVVGELQHFNQGKISSSFTFEYGKAVVENSHTAYVVRCRNAFLLAAFVSSGADPLFPRDKVATFLPGDLADTIAPKLPQTVTKEQWLRSL